MAYASVASLLQTIDLLNYHHDDDSSISSRFKDQITSLHKNTSFLQSFLEDGDPNRAKNWEETIRDVSDRAEEIIDLLVSDSLLKSSMSELDCGVDELEKVAREMDSIVDRVQVRSTELKDYPDEDLIRILDLLTYWSYNRETIAIVGTGGMVKSTLARNAYNHPLVKEHFNIRAWCTVGQEYSNREIYLDILRCINVQSASDTSLDCLYHNLYQSTYLIVLQDICSVDAWNNVRHAFPDNRRGSRIIMTTRSPELASSASHVHEMSLLDEDDVWDALREKIFKGDPCPSQLENYGKIISNGCRGLRLTIDLVCGILAADQTEAAWEDVSENIKIASREDDSGFPRALSLSYTYLPHHLRPCFLYLVCFPENHEIRVSKLIKMWVAEGFLTQSETKSFQEMGEEHPEILVRRSLVLVSKRKFNGRIKSIIVHGLVRELCLRQAQMGYFINSVGRFGRFDELWPSCRRVSSSNYSHNFLEGVYASTIRTVILYGEEGVRWSIASLTLLRILDLSNAYGYDLPEEVFHLRYLAFKYGFSISEAISNLQNLQTLIICPRVNGRVFDTLLDGIWRMPQLRHLLNFSFKLPTPEQGEAKHSALENLETLSTVIDFVCSKQNLGMIPNVKKLSVSYTKSFKDAVEDIELHNLISLHKLEILKVEVEGSFVEQPKASFAFPPTLKKLILSGCKFPWEDMKIVASLPNLEMLKLRNHAFVGKTWETSEGGFSRLTFLMIKESDLEHWITEISHFPMLKLLMLHRCWGLVEIPEDFMYIPTLKLIEVDDCNGPLLRSAEVMKYDQEEMFGECPVQIRFIKDS